MSHAVPKSSNHCICPISGCVLEFAMACQLVVGFLFSEASMPWCQAPLSRHDSRAGAAAQRARSPLGSCAPAPKGDSWSCPNAANASWTSRNLHCKFSYLAMRVCMQKPLITCLIRNLKLRFCSNTPQHRPQALVKDAALGRRPSARLAKSGV